MKSFLVAGIFWVPVVVVGIICDLPGWTYFVYVLPFTLGTCLIEYGTKQEWF